MKNKPLYILAAILLVLGGAAAFKIYFPKISPSANLYSNSIKSFNGQKVTSVEIANKDNTLKFSKANGQWSLNGEKVVPDKIEGLVKKVLDANQAELVSETNIKHKDFEVTDDLATKIKLNNDSQFLLGKAAFGGGLYIRISGRDNVYLVKNLTSNDASVDLQQWYDKTIISIDHKDIKTIKIVKGNETFTIAQQGEKWVWQEGNKELKQDKAGSVALKLASFQAKELIPSSQSGEMAKPDVSINIESGKGTENLDIYKVADGYIVDRKSDGKKFKIDEAAAKDVLVSLKDLQG